MFAEVCRQLASWPVFFFFALDVPGRSSLNVGRFHVERSVSRSFLMDIVFVLALHHARTKSAHCSLTGLLLCSRRDRVQVHRPDVYPTLTYTTESLFNRSTDSRPVPRPISVLDSWQPRCVASNPAADRAPQVAQPCGRNP